MNPSGVQTDGLMVSAPSGAILSVERFEDGRVAVWVAPPGEDDGPSVPLSEENRRRVAEFLLKGLS